MTPNTALNVRSSMRFAEREAARSHDFGFCVWEEVLFLDTSRSKIKRFHRVSRYGTSSNIAAGSKDDEPRRALPRGEERRRQTRSSPTTGLSYWQLTDGELKFWQTQSNNTKQRRSFQGGKRAAPFRAVNLNSCLFITAGVSLGGGKEGLGTQT